MLTTLVNKFRAVCVSILAVFSGGSLGAAEHYVSVHSSFFSPSFLEINPGDTVTWVNFDEFFDHTVTSDDNAWLPAGLLVGEGDTFTLQFNTVGSYGYHDVDGFTGTISVVPASVGNVAPSVSITSPGAGTIFTAPASVEMMADASDSDGSIAGVEFFLDAVTSLGNDTESPYSVTITNLAAGNYLLTATATDNLGATATSTVLISVITNATISAPNLTGGQVQFSFTTIPNQTYMIEYSTNLVEWFWLNTQTAGGSTLDFIDSETAAFERRFFRIKSE